MAINFSLVVGERDGDYYIQTAERTDINNNNCNSYLSHRIIDSFPWITKRKISQKTRNKKPELKWY